MGRLRTPLARGRTFSALWDELAIRRKELKARRVGKPPQDPRFSIVSAVYNVEKYLDDYFSSIVLQPEFLGQIQVIVVNDGSTDRSLDILNAWRRRFPHNITVVSKENGGQASARNLGMTYATGEWITFIDPDDFIDARYFSEARQFIDRHLSEVQPLHLVSCNTIFFREATRQLRDDHPLKFRFEKDAVAVSSDMGRFIQLSAASVLFRRSAIADLKFPDNVKPSFEDGYFVAKFILSNGACAVGFSKYCIYYYRKREDSTSTLDAAEKDHRRYSDVFVNGYLPLLHEARKLHGGSTPVWLQRTVLYDMCWHMKSFVGHDEKLSFLTDDQRNLYRRCLERVFAYVDRETIENFELIGIWDMYRIGMLMTFKAERLDSTRLVIDNIDTTTNSMVVRWFSGVDSDDLVITINGVPASEVERGYQIHRFCGQTFAYECRVRFRTSRGMIRASLNDAPVSLELAGKRRKKNATVAEAVSLAKTHANDQGTNTPHVIRTRALAHNPTHKTQFANCWLLMDRDTAADDNAEHLYRYLKNHAGHINAYFVIRRDSAAWDRLAQDGFRLIEFASDAHAAAMFQADYIISSHADDYVFNHLPIRDYGDLLNYRLVFLQHGVTQNDLSQWLNRKPISLTIAATEAERGSMVSNRTGYKFLPSQVACTGFPRHDALLRKGLRTPDRRLLIMPTWRESNLPKTAGRTSARALNEEFMTTEYARAWRSLLHSPRLASMLRKYGFEAAFCPHPNIQPYLNWFDAPEHIDLMEYSHSRSIQDAFADARVLVTDYSSVAFEMAYIDRAVAYYQFDHDTVFNGAHTARKGYFDYERDGFGPVRYDEHSLLDAIEQILANDGVVGEEYAIRALTTFKWRDGYCCERVVEAIERMGQWPETVFTTFSPANTEPEFDVHGVTRSGRARFPIARTDRRMAMEALSAISASECGY